MSVQIRKPYGKPPVSRLQFRDDEGVHDGRTEQHHKDQCDIGCILHRYDKTGLITHVNQAKAMYGDFTEVNEYQESLNLVIKAQNSFDELPSEIRKRFHNDPGEFLEFATNPENHDAMVKMGLAHARESAQPIEKSKETPKAEGKTEAE